MEQTQPLRTLFKLINLRLLGAILLTFFLGIGAAYHLGVKLNFLDILLAFLICISLVEMRDLLAAYYDHPQSPWTTLHRDDDLFSILSKVKLPLLLQTALLILTAGAVLTVILVFRKAVNISGVLLLGVSLLVCFFSATPPIRFEKKGYGELLEAMLVANLVPALAFILQGAQWHILLIMVTLPLTLIYLAMKIALSFESFGYELSHGNRSITTRIGWRRALQMHNLLILFAFVLVGAFFLMGLPWGFTWPLLLGLPLGVYQIIQLQQIAAGVKPRWVLLKWTSIGLFFVMTYLVTISLWIR